MKKNYFLLVAIIVTTFSFSQGSEDFGNSTATGSYADGSFVGNNSVTWTYTHSRDAIGNAGTPSLPTAGQMPALMLRRASDGSTVISSTVSGGIADFSVKLYKQFTGGGDRQVELFINGSSAGVSTAFDDYDEHIFSVIGINVAGSFTIEIRNITSKQIAIDDISWTAFAGTPTPTLSINSPAENEVMPSGDVTVDYAINNFNVATAGSGDGHFHWQLDGGTETMVYIDTGILELTGLAPGSHTLVMSLRDDSNAPLSPAVSSTVNFTVQAYTDVATIAALRAGTIGDYYNLTGEALINYSQSFRSQKWIQDATAGILIDDQPGNITSAGSSSRGDGLTGIRGRLGAYQGMMQFIPSLDVTTVTSPSSVTIVPEVVTLANLTAMSEDYEAELIKVEAVTFSTAGNFENGTIYPMAQGGDSFDFRTNFYNVDYITTAIPTTTTQDIVGLVAQNSAGYTFVARDLGDFLTTASVGENNIEGFAVYPNPVNNGEFTIKSLSNTTKQVQIFDMLGKMVYSNVVQANENIQVSNLNAGIYILKVAIDGKTATRKLIIQ